MKVEKGFQEEGTSWPGARRLARRKNPPGQVLRGRSSWPGGKRKDPPGQMLGGRSSWPGARRKILLARC